MISVIRFRYWFVQKIQFSRKNEDLFINISIFENFVFYAFGFLGFFGKFWNLQYVKHLGQF